MDFLSDMSDIVQFDVNTSPLIVYDVKNNNHLKRQTFFIEPAAIPNNLTLPSNQQLNVSTFKSNVKLSQNFD